MAAGIVRINQDVDAIYSPDDGGWYLQDYPSDRVSADIYATSDEAMRAYCSCVTWAWADR